MSPPAAPAAPAPTQVHHSAHDLHEVNPFERSFASPPPSSTGDQQVQQVQRDQSTHAFASSSSLNPPSDSNDADSTLAPIPPPQTDHDHDDVDPRLPRIPPPEVLEFLQKHPDHSPKPSLPGMKHISPSLNLPDDLDRFKNWASLAEKWGHPGQGTPLSPGSLLSLAAPPTRSGANTPSGLSRVLGNGHSPGSKSASPPRQAFMGTSGNGGGGGGGGGSSSAHSSPALGLRNLDPVQSNGSNGFNGAFAAGKPKIPLPSRRLPNSSSSSLFQIASQIPTPTPIYTSLAARSSAPSSAETWADSSNVQYDAISSPADNPMSPAQASQLSAAPSPALRAISSSAQAPTANGPTPPPSSSTPLRVPSPPKHEPTAMQPPTSLGMYSHPHPLPPPGAFAMMPHTSAPLQPFAPGHYPYSTNGNGPPMYFASLPPPPHLAYASHPHQHPAPPFLHAQQPFRPRSASLTPAPGTPAHPPTSAPNSMSMSPAPPAPIPSAPQSPMPQQRQTYNEQGYAHYRPPQQHQQHHDLSDLPAGFLGHSHGPTDITRLGVEHIPVIPPQKKGNTKRKVDYEALDDKRKEFLERNRKAAMKCRQRKKQQLTLMETKAQGFTIHNEQLDAQLNVFRNEIDRLQAALRLANAAHCAPTAMAALAVPPPPPTAAVYTDVSADAMDVDDGDEG